AAGRGVHWVRPELVAQVAYTEMTADGSLRHPVFRGLREDKAAGDVVFESPAPSDPDTSSGGDMGTGRSQPRKASRGASRSQGGTSARTAGQRKDRVEVAGISLSNPDKVL